MESPYATIVDNPNFDPVLHAELLDRALKASDKDAIVKVLTSISNNQRQKMRDPYRIIYGEDLIAVLDKKLGGERKLKKTVFALMDAPLDYDVKQLKEAMKGLGTDEAVLIEILCSRTPDQLAAIRVAYEDEYKTPLEKDIADITSGEFKDLLVALATGSKDDGRGTNEEQAKELADKGAPSHFFTILTSQNQYQLRKVFEQFAILSGTTIEKAIENEFSGEVQKTYLTIVKASTDKQKFFAEQLYYSMKGLGTNDNELIRVLVNRSEVDLQLVKETFEEMYSQTLADMIKGDTSGQYRDALLALVAGNRQQ